MLNLLNLNINIQILRPVSLYRDDNSFDNFLDAWVRLSAIYTQPNHVKNWKGSLLRFEPILWLVGKIVVKEHRKSFDFHRNYQKGKMRFQETVVYLSTWPLNYRDDRRQDCWRFTVSRKLTSSLLGYNWFANAATIQQTAEPCVTNLSERTNKYIWSGWLAWAVKKHIMLTGISLTDIKA